MKRILILGGGISKERDVSLETAKQVNICLKKKFKTIICEPDKNLVKNIKKFKPTIIFNALHGRFGEDGYIQSILEKIKIKYTHSGIISSFISMNKILSKELFIKNKILTPKFIKYDFKNNHTITKKIISKIDKKLKFPVVIKPINEGSSVDVFICSKKNILGKLKKLKKYNEIIIEKYIGGREIQVAILGKKKLGAIELKPKRKFYDYTAKYSSKAKTEHIIPVDLEKKNLDKVLNISLKAHKLLGCRGVTRSDFKFYKNKFYLLELNTQPGMTKLSLVPEIAAHRGISFYKLLEWIVNDASIKR
ncbi:MAG: D-alanine--D-alanine ligase [Candidatus Pelagibacter sp.]|tara:strand:+ start:1797 stop:2714 length:918 start_codon:yes stop_codon:yes gene_type:complete